MKQFKITATVIDNNNEPVRMNTVEALGDVHQRIYLTLERAKEAVVDLGLNDSFGACFEIEEEEFEGFVEGQKYDVQSVIEAGITVDDLGYQMGDYFDYNGCYLGPDEHDIEPTI